MLRAGNTQYQLFHQFIPSAMCVHTNMTPASFQWFAVAEESNDRAAIAENQVLVYGSENA